MPSMIKETVRKLRKASTPSEYILWQMLRNRKFCGMKFLKQHAIYFDYQGKKRFYVADFYCHEKTLVLELDGKIHEKQAEHDEYRTFIINQLGIKVVRFNNEELSNISLGKDKLRILLLSGE